MSENSSLKAAIDKDFVEVSSEYYSIVKLAREYKAPVLAMVDRQDIKYIKNKLDNLLKQIEHLPEDGYKKRIQQEIITVLDSISYSLQYRNV